MAFSQRTCLTGRQGGAQIGDMGVVRGGDVDGVDVRIGIEVLNRFIDLLDAILLSKSLGLGQRAVGDARKLAAGQREGLGHLVGNNAATDHSPTELGSRKMSLGNGLSWTEANAALAAAAASSGACLESAIMCLLCHRTSCISDSSIFAQTRASVRVFAYLTAKRSLLPRKRPHIYA